MLPLASRIQVETPATGRRRTRRHALNLPLAGATRAVVENLSETGLALQTSAALAVGDTFEIELPLAGTVTAKVTWSEAELFGCEFTQPVSRAAVSAARLRSPFEDPSPSEQPAGFAELRRPVVPNYALATGVMIAFAAVAAMFVAAMLTAPFASF